MNDLERSREEWIMCSQRVTNHFEYMREHDPEIFAAVMTASGPMYAELLTKGLDAAAEAWNKYQQS